jgi:hypothetical protein
VSWLFFTCRRKILLRGITFGPFCTLETSVCLKGEYEKSNKQIFDFCLLWLISSVKDKFMTEVNEELNNEQRRI